MILTEIGNYLVAQGFGTLGTTLFLSQLPDGPDTLIGVLESPGGEPEFVLGQVLPRRENSRIQVLNRAPLWLTARTTAEAISLSLGSVVNQTLSGTYYLAITPSRPPTQLQWDATRGVVFTSTFECKKSIS